MAVGELIVAVGLILAVTVDTGDVAVTAVNVVIFVVGIMVSVVPLVGIVAV